ncbi:TRAP transporter permease [Thermodesulfobacteriota bacterium]
MKKLPSGWRWIARASLTLIPVTGVLWALDIQLYLGWQLHVQQMLSLMLLLILTSCFITVPARKGASRERLPWYDILFALLSLPVGGYMAVSYPRLLLEVSITPINIALGLIAAILVIEAARRTMGQLVAGMGASFLVFGLFGNSLNLHPVFYSFQRWIFLLYSDPNFILGIPLRLMSTVVLLYLTFAGLLLSTGGGPALMNFALASLGRFKGGPAKVAVIASGLLGTLMGAPPANVATTGAITIPLMKKMGYRPEFAGAVEAVASTGGTILPPVMGATAFLMAEFLQMTYAEIAMVAAAPAVILYLGVLLQVHLRASKLGLKGLPSDKLPSLGKSAKEMCIFLFPILVLIYALLVERLPADLAALYGIASLLVLAGFRRQRLSILRKLPYILEDIGRTFLPLGVVVSMAGIIIGVVLHTALATDLTYMIKTLATGNVIPLLVLTAIVCLIMGMGLPVIVAYVLLVVLIGPAITALGVVPLAAHFFIYYFGVAAYITPPYCTAVYVAQTLAESNLIKTGLEAVKLALPLYILPFFWVFNPSFLLVGSPAECIFAILRSALAVFVIIIALEGYLRTKLDYITRILSIVAGLALFVSNLTIQLSGVTFATLLLVWHWKVGGSAVNMLKILNRK